MLIRARTSVALLASVLCIPGCSKQTPTPTLKQIPETPIIELRQTDDQEYVFVAAGRFIHFDDFIRMSPARLSQKFIVWAGQGPIDPRFQTPVALAGSYKLGSEELIFRPRFPVKQGLRYYVYFDPDPTPRMPEGDAGGPRSEPICRDFLIPEKLRRGTTIVGNVFPTPSTLPENLLKFYLHFSAPMSRGEAYQRIHLLDAAGKEVKLPFLELNEELWNADQTRFTLFFDPGRIKRELLPRELVGPAIEAGKSYTLVIDRDWLDAEGQPLKEGFKKPFKVGPPDEKQPDPKTWKLTPPAAGSMQPLTVDFPKPMDHALLERVLRVVGEKGGALPGTVEVTNEETRWQFTPKAAWTAGSYFLEVETILEDLAGNNFKKPFEVDLFGPIQKRVETEHVRIGFDVK